jgi:CheY-like chemotaxis protein
MFEPAQKPHTEKHQALADKHPRRVPHVLIVDDDVDSALLVDSTFRSLGCETEFALDPREAQRKISSGKSDIIVLDWLLDSRVSADQVVARAMASLEKFERRNRRGSAGKTRIITYSGLDGHDIHLPISRHYEHVDHWQKPLRRQDLARKTMALLKELGF